MSKIHIIGGGTLSHVRNHLALAAPAFGTTARELAHKFASNDPGKANTDPQGGWDEMVWANDYYLHLTKMADPTSKLVTNDDVAALLNTLIADPETRVIILNAALCDYNGFILENDPENSTFSNKKKITLSGSHDIRLKTSDGNQEMKLVPADKLVGSIRKVRKDIFVVAFKTTTGATSDEQYKIALNALKRDSVNLVVANDTVTRNNMIVAPEETRYFETTNRDEMLDGLVKMVLARSTNTFTRSTVIDEGTSVPWDSDLIPDNLRKVVNHCINRGAYKPFRGVTAGHFAVKLDEGRVLTSKRKRNFNNLSDEGLVLVEYEDDTKVIAHGAKPSVGGQSQRIVFREHPELDCIVHAHVPLKENPRDFVNIASQMEYECGSHNCGANTSRNLRPYSNDIHAVMLDNHGPNIVFNRNTPAAEVIDFIEANFDLEKKTGGLVD
jgi:hypothetical protein